MSITARTGAGSEEEQGRISLELCIAASYTHATINVTMSLCHHVTMPPSHHANMSPCHHATTRWQSPREQCPTPLTFAMYEGVATWYRTSNVKMEDDKLIRTWKNGGSQYKEWRKLVCTTFSLAGALSAGAQSPSRIVICNNHTHDGQGKRQAGTGNKSNFKRQHLKESLQRALELSQDGSGIGTQLPCLLTGDFNVDHDQATKDIIPEGWVYVASTSQKRDFVFLRSGAQAVHLGRDQHRLSAHDGAHTSIEVEISFQVPSAGASSSKQSPGAQSPSAQVPSAGASSSKAALTKGVSVGSHVARIEAPQLEESPVTKMVRDEILKGLADSGVVKKSVQKSAGASGSSGSGAQGSDHVGAEDASGAESPSKKDQAAEESSLPAKSPQGVALEGFPASKNQLFQQMVQASAEAQEAREEVQAAAQEAREKAMEKGDEEKMDEQMGEDISS